MSQISSVTKTLADTIPGANLRFGILAWRFTWRTTMNKCFMWLTLNRINWVSYIRIKLIILKLNLYLQFWVKPQTISIKKNSQNIEIFIVIIKVFNWRINKMFFHLTFYIIWYVNSSSCFIPNQYFLLNIYEKTCCCVVKLS